MPDHLQPRSGGRTGRRGVTRDFRRSFLIFCEGEETEPRYFEAWRVTKTVKVIGTGHNTLSLVKEAIQKRDDYIAKGKNYDEVWCVFDRDDHNPQHFNSAIALARREEIQVAYSNEAFELWYILHFILLNNSSDRVWLRNYLKANLAGGYEKNRTDIYECLLSKQETALRNAKQLMAGYGENHNPLRDNPSTTVHLLVEALNKNSAGSR